MDEIFRALIELGGVLQSRGYRFVAIAPATHGRVLRRAAAATSLESIFGWNRPFHRDVIEGNLIKLLEEANALDEQDGLYKSKVRFATIDDLLFAHSGFPTAEQDAVFFGPDTYRFVRLLRASLADIALDGPVRLIDIGSGSGAGGIAAARLLGKRAEVLLGDINRTALAFR